MNILVIGGAGYIGSHVVEELKKSNYNVVILDDLSKGHKEVADILNTKLYVGDLGDYNLVRKILKDEKIDSVMHFAAFTEVGESVVKPREYYNNNTAKVIKLLDAMLDENVLNFVFSSTAATFGVPMSEKIDENHPQNPINPYGMSKLMVEKILSDYDKAYGFKSVILRYFNASGASSTSEIGESHNPESHLIPIVLKTAKGERESISVFGSDYETFDGTCIRDYIHVTDLANAHIKAMEKMIKENKSLNYNLGSSTGYSVFEIIDKVKEVTKKDFKVEIKGRRSGDPAKLIADNQKFLKELNLALTKNLDEIVLSAWKWEQNKKY